MKLSKCGEAWYWRVVLQLRSGQTASSWCDEHRMDRKSLGRWKSYFRAAEMNLAPEIDEQALRIHFSHLAGTQVRSKANPDAEHAGLSPYRGQQPRFVAVQIKAVCHAE